MCWGIRSIQSLQSIEQQDLVHAKRMASIVEKTVQSFNVFYCQKLIKEYGLLCLEEDQETVTIKEEFKSRDKELRCNYFETKVDNPFVTRWNQKQGILKVLGSYDVQGNTEQELEGSLKGASERLQKELQTRQQKVQAYELEIFQGYQGRATGFDFLKWGLTLVAFLALTGVALTLRRQSPATTAIRVGQVGGGIAAIACGVGAWQARTAAGWNRAVAAKWDPKEKTI